MKAVISFSRRTVSVETQVPASADELLAWMRGYRDTVEEIAFFTGANASAAPAQDHPRRSR